MFFNATQFHKIEGVTVANNCPSEVVSGTEGNLEQENDSTNVFLCLTGLLDDIHFLPTIFRVFFILFTSFIRSTSFVLHDTCFCLHSMHLISAVHTFLIHSIRFSTPQTFFTRSTRFCSAPNTFCSKPHTFCFFFFFFTACTSIS